MVNSAFQAAPAQLSDKLDRQHHLDNIASQIGFDDVRS
ncbi:Unknown protein sequence [Pseudomonas coronafaciens pv. oryzae]|nr:Unknown protein sequence [Pseudomonas coronafaciens pv. oryzae]